MENNEVINNRYKVKKKLGEGGMGAVLLVEDNQKENQELALKKVLSKAGQGSIIDILKHEFEVLTQLRHPNIAEAYDYGVIQGTTENYFTTEYIKGIDFYRGTKDKPIEEALEYFVQCCRGLDYVHSRGLVHQDLKPDNILITISDDGETAANSVKIIDFGLIDRENYTGGAVRGTPQFIAPEKLKGENVDRRSDLYSFGIVMYFVLTRRLPFAAKSNKALILKHLYEDPAPPSEIRSDIGSNLEKIILKLMNKEPSDRYMSAADIIRAFNELMGKNFLIETDESVQSYILSGKFVGRTSEITNLKTKFDQVFKKFKDKADKEAKTSKMSAADALDALVMGTADKEEEVTDKEEEALLTSQMVMLGGTSGVGKSRIMREFKYYVQLNHVQFHEFPGAEGSSDPILKGILKGAVGIADPKVLENPEYRQELSKFVPDQVTPPESLEEEQLGPNEAKIRMLERLSQFMVEASDNHPFVIYAANLQWVDDLSLRALTYLANLLYREAEAGRPHPILLVGCYRDEELGQSALGPLLQQVGGRNYLTMHRVTQLSPEHMTELLQSMFGTEEIPPAFLEGLLSEAKGNPLFLEEMLKAMVEDKKIIRSGGQWEFPKSLEGIQIPQNIADILLSRLQALPPKSQAVLQALAVNGKPTTANLVATVTRWRVSEILDLLKDLEQRQIVNRSIVDDEVYFSFFHTKVRETVYTEIPDKTLKLIHQRTGEALEELYGERKDDHAPELAQHFLKAEIRDKGLDYGFKAAEQLKNSYAMDEAVEMYSQVVELLGPADVKKKTQTYLTMANLYEFLGRHKQGINKLNQVLSGSRLNKMIRVQLQRKIAFLYLGMGKVDEALGIVEKALADLRNPLAPERGLCLGTLGLIQLRMGNLSEAGQCLAEANEILETAQKEVELIGVTNALGILNFNQGNTEEAVRYFTKCKDLCGKADNQQGQGAAEANLASTYIEAGQYEEALKHNEEARQIFQKIGDQKATVLTKFNQADLESQMGSLADAGDIAEDAHQQSEEMNDDLLLAKTSYMLGSIQKLRGKYSAVQDLLDSAAKFADYAQDQRMATLVAAKMGEFYMDTGRFDEAKPLLKIALETAKSMGFPYLFAQISRLQGLLSCRKGDAHTSKKALDASLATWKEMKFPLEAVKNLITQARCAGEFKAYQEGMNILNRCRGIVEKTGSDRLTGEFLLTKGFLTRGLGRSDEAREILGRALDYTKNIDYKEALVEVLLLLGACGTKDDPITQRYQKIARQLLTNLGDQLPEGTSQGFYQSKRALLSF